MLPLWILSASKMGIGGLLSFLELVIQLLITGSDAAEGAGFQFSTSASKKINPIILSGDWWHPCYQSLQLSNGSSNCCKIQKTIHIGEVARCTLALWP